MDYDVGLGAKNPWRKQKKKAVKKKVHEDQNGRSRLE